jgi:ABC-2 type transport system permease protein
MMHKLWTIARREFQAMVATKAFLLSITMMPLLMFGGILFAGRMNKSGDVADRHILVVDGTGGELYADLERMVQVRNAAVAAAGGPGKDDDAKGDEGDGQRQPRYVLERFEKDSVDDDQRLSLSERVRQGELKAFVEIPAGIIDAANANSDDATTAAGNTPPEVRFYAPAAMFSSERGWLEFAINDAVRARRLKQLDLDPALVARATAQIPVVGRGLVKKLSGGRVGGGDASQNMTSIFLPFGFMMLMFMVIMLSAQPLMESVMEEKTGRIAEVLLGSVSPFQLMLGKLLGNVAGSLTVVGIYGAGGYALAAYKGWTDKVPWDLVPYFLVFQVLAVLLFSSLFMSVGAAVTQLKEAQSMLLPVWLIMCAPMFVWLQIAREPNGSLAMAFSFIPPTAPLVMVLRLASEEVVPAWHIALSLALLAAATVAITFLAARIFRVGMLWQGKTPKFTELFRWAWSG